VSVIKKILMMMMLMNWQVVLVPVVLKGAAGLDELVCERERVCV